MLDDKIEMSTVKVASDDGRLKTVTAREDPSFVETQTRTRRLFSLPQIFFFSLMYFSTWPGMGNNMYFALINGGPAAYFFNLIIVLIGALSQALSLGELASLMPVAGAQYYWTYHFAPAKYKLFLSWLSGWATWLGYICGLAGVLNSLVLLVQNTVQVNFPDYEGLGWQTTVLIIASLALMTILNVWLFRIVPWLEFWIGILNIFFFFTTIITLWVMAPRNSADFMLTKVIISGWENQSEFVGWNVGMLTQVFMYVGFEAVVHMGEETKNPRRAAPIAMVWSIAANGVMGLIVTATYIICMPGFDETIASKYPFLYLMENATGSKTVTTVVAVGVCIAQAGCAMSFYSSVSRMTWAWARDGGLPSYFGHVSGSRRVPVRAVVLTCVLIAILGLLNLNSDAFIALGAVTSLSSMALFFSYVIILSITLYLRLTTGLPKAEWSVGRAAIPLNIFALVFTVYMMIWLPFPTGPSVDAKTMNWCGPVFGLVMLGALGSWFAWAKDNWPGPNLAIVDFILRNADGK